MRKLNERFLLTLVKFIFPFNTDIIIAIDLGFQVCGFLYSVTVMFLGGGVWSYSVSSGLYALKTTLFFQGIERDLNK